LVALTVFAVGEGFSSVVGNADGETVSATFTESLLSCRAPAAYALFAGRLWIVDNA
jgi:hypothetical protein